MLTIHRELILRPFPRVHRAACMQANYLYLDSANEFTEKIQAQQEVQKMLNGHLTGGDETLVESSLVPFKTSGTSIEAVPVCEFKLQLLR